MSAEEFSSSSCSCFVSHNFPPFPTIARMSSSCFCCCSYRRKFSKEESSRLCNTNRAMSDPSKRETHSTPISHERSKSRSCLKQSKLFPQILKNLTKQLKQTKHFLPVIHQSLLWMLDLWRGRSI